MKTSIPPSRARCASLITLVLGAIAVAGVNGAGEPLAQPLAWKTLPSYGGVLRFTEYSGFSTIGRIYEINRSAANIAILSKKPFWAPKPGVFGRVALWPANTLLIVQIAVGSPINIDGKRVGFNELAVGQTLSVQYSIYSGGYCAARRIEARAH